MVEVDFYEVGKVRHELLEYAIIPAEYEGKWIFVRHKERETLEIPGGHREKNEDINSTAKRELFEETGARKFDIKPLWDYSVTKNGVVGYGRLFYAHVKELGRLPDLEIEEIKLFDNLPDKLTYAQVQPHLFNKVLEWKRGYRNK